MQLQAKVEAWARTFLGLADAGNLRDAAAGKEERQDGDRGAPNAGGDHREALNDRGDDADVEFEA